MNLQDERGIVPSAYLYKNPERIARSACQQTLGKPQKAKHTAATTRLPPRTCSACAACLQHGRPNRGGRKAGPNQPPAGLAHPLVAVQQQALGAAPAALRCRAGGPGQLGRGGLQHPLQQQQAVIGLLPAGRGGKQFLCFAGVRHRRRLCGCGILLRPGSQHICQLWEQGRHAAAKGGALHLR